MPILRYRLVFALTAEHGQTAESEQKQRQRWGLDWLQLAVGTGPAVYRLVAISRVRISPRPTASVSADVSASLTSLRGWGPAIYRYVVYLGNGIWPRKVSCADEPLLTSIYKPVFLLWGILRTPSKCSYSGCRSNSRSARFVASSELV